MRFKPQTDGKEEGQLLRFTLGQLVQHLCTWFFLAVPPSTLGRQTWSSSWAGFHGVSGLSPSTANLLPSVLNSKTHWSSGKFTLKTKPVLNHVKVRDSSKPGSSWEGDLGLPRRLAYSLPGESTVLEQRQGHAGGASGCSSQGQTPASNSHSICLNSYRLISHNRNGIWRSSRWLSPPLNTSLTV